MTRPSYATPIGSNGACVTTCIHAYDHHGAHEDLAGRRWHSREGKAADHVPWACAACGELEDAEVARLQQGGELRPGQREPGWRARGEAPPPRRVRGASMIIGGRVTRKRAAAEGGAP